MGSGYKIKPGTYGLVAKVKVLDTKSGLCFESEIFPEEITTNHSWSVDNPNETLMSFSPITVPNVKGWDAEWSDRRAEFKWLRERRTSKNIAIKKIIFSGPCTIVLWEDGTKTMARVSDGETFDSEKGVAVCFMKKIMGHTETNKLLRKAHDQYNKEKQKVLRERASKLLDKIKEVNDTYKPTSCNRCAYFRCSLYYGDNTIVYDSKAFGCCMKCKRNMTSTDPYNEVPSWCPMEYYKSKEAEDADKV